MDDTAPPFKPKFQSSKQTNKQTMNANHQAIDMKIYFEENERKETRKIEISRKRSTSIKFWEFAQEVMIVYRLLEPKSPFTTCPYGDFMSDNYNITYVDSDGDTIHFGTDDELQKALRDILQQSDGGQTKKNPVFKVYITRKKL